MAAKSIAELESVLGQTILTLEKRVDSINTSVDGLVTKGADAVGLLAEMKKDLAVLRTELEALSRWKVELGDAKSDIAVIKSEIAELKKMKDNWGNRF